MQKWMVIPALAGAIVIADLAMVANADKSDNQSTCVLTDEAAGDEVATDGAQLNV